MNGLRDVEAIRADLAKIEWHRSVRDMGVTPEVAYRVAADVQSLLAALADRDAKLAAVLENPPTPSIPRSANTSYWEGWEDAIDIFGQRFAALMGEPA